MARRRKIPPALLALLIVLIAAAAYIASGMAASPAPAGNGSPSNTPASGTNTSANASAGGTLRIASFNIQVFGQSKRSKPEVMDVLAKTARQFDIMVVQELRDESETTLPFYIESINALPGPEYAAVSGPRLGRTSSKENYAFIYNTETIAFVPGSDYTFADPPEGTEADLFQREPLIARFSSKNGAFDFVLITIHTDPDETPQELAGLPLVLSDAMGRYGNEADFILLGDMNADCSYLSASEAASLALRNSSFTWLVPDDADTTVKSTDCAYDRIILAGNATAAYSGEWGIFRFDEEYGLNQSGAEAVSDHYPVWAVFSSS
jgi:endonuclease/exonuclease/phosphatase family metal-dependent hydrolase